MKKCIFCDLKTTLKESGRKELFRDALVTVFESKAKDAKKHLLIIPNKHLIGTENLDHTHEGLLKHMLEVAQGVVGKNHKKYIMGFHKSPFSSVDHLHMHCVLPPFKSWWIWWKYADYTPFFISVENLITHIKK